MPLVAGCMGMILWQPLVDMAVDGVFWQLLAYCAGVGGSMLIIGSAAGVVVMGLEKITFGWYELHLLDCFRRLHRRYRLLLVHPLPSLYAI